MSIIPFSMCYNLVVSKVNEKEKNLGSKFLNLLMWILLLCFLLIPGYFFYISFISKDGSLPTASEILETINKNSPNISPDDWEKEDWEDDTESIYEEDPVVGENFFEKFPIVNTQQCYVAIPMRVDTLTPPPIVIYNHGDGETVLENISGDFMEKLRKYSDIFASNNYIFTASNLHDNASDTDPLIDISSLISWIKDNYTSSNDIYLIGFSRGGYTTTRYMLKNPEDIKAAALLAPATYYTEWGEEEVNKIANIDIKIWHGDEDTNIAIIHSINFVNQLANYNKSISFSEERGKAHYDVDDEYILDILDFFEITVQ